MAATRHSLPPLLLGLFLLLVTTTTNAVSIDTKTQSIHFQSTHDSLLAQASHRRQAIMAQFLSKQTLATRAAHPELLQVGEHIAKNATNTSNTSNIDWGDKKIITDGESVFETEPQREANVLVDDFVNGTDPLKWLYPSTSLLDEAGVTNASKMSYGYLVPDKSALPATGGLWFKGDAMNNVPVRSRHPYSQGMDLRVSLNKDTIGTGPSHFVVLSTNPEFKQWL
jgi:hypothetical protein